MCGNSAVSDGFIISVLSIAEHTKEKINLFFATMSLTEIDPSFTPVSENDICTAERILKDKNAESSVTVIDMTDGYKKELAGGKNEASRYTPYAMLRLLADLYPLPERLLYLDTDIIACSDICELYELDLCGRHIAGVKDYYGSKFIRPGYMNSGVMLWDLARMRDDGVLAAARGICRERKMLLPDQTALNRCANIKLVGRRYNEQHREREDTVIRHFSMRIRWMPFRTENIKPWNVDGMHNVLGTHRFDLIIEKWKNIKKGILK